MGVRGPGGRQQPAVHRRDPELDRRPGARRAAAGRRPRRRRPPPVATGLLVAALGVLRLVPASRHDAASTAAGPEAGPRNVSGRRCVGGVQAHAPLGRGRRRHRSCCSATNLIDGSSEVLLLLVSDRRLGLGDGGYGLLNAAIGDRGAGRRRRQPPDGRRASPARNRSRSPSSSPERPTPRSARGRRSARRRRARAAPRRGQRRGRGRGRHRRCSEPCPRTHLARVFGIARRPRGRRHPRRRRRSPRSSRARSGSSGALVATRRWPGRCWRSPLAPEPVARRGHGGRAPSTALRPLVDVLADLPLLRHAPDPVLASLGRSPRTTVERSRRASVVVDEGAPPDDVYVVLDGTLRRAPPPARRHRRPRSTSATPGRLLRRGRPDDRPGPQRLGDRPRRPAGCCGSRATPSSPRSTATPSGPAARRRAGIVGRVANPVEPDVDRPERRRSAIGT